MNCPLCRSEQTWRDEVDIGVGVQYGPWRCNDCGWSQEDVTDPDFSPGPPDGNDCDSEPYDPLPPNMCKGFAAFAMLFGVPPDDCDDLDRTCEGCVELSHDGKDCDDGVNPCPDHGSCHGALVWCDHCGDVGAENCDDNDCDQHRYRIQPCSDGEQGFVIFDRHHHHALGDDRGEVVYMDRVGAVRALEYFEQHDELPPHDADDAPVCRRCEDCEGEEHHWNDCILQDAEDYPDHPAAKAGHEIWYVCKHCPAWRVDLDDDGDDGDDDFDVGWDDVGDDDALETHPYEPGDGGDCAACGEARTSEIHDDDTTDEDVVEGDVREEERRLDGVCQAHGTPDPTGICDWASAQASYQVLDEDDGHPE